MPKSGHGHDIYSHCPNPRAISGLTNTVVIEYLKISFGNDLRKTYKNRTHRCYVIDMKAVLPYCFIL